jgi:hypothetical protein
MRGDCETGDEQQLYRAHFRDSQASLMAARSPITLRDTDQ